MCAYLLRNIPIVLWVRFRAKAKAEGQTARAVLIRLMLGYMRG